MTPPAFDNARPPVQWTHLFWPRDLAIALTVFFVTWAVARQFHPYQLIAGHTGATWINGFFLACAAAALVSLALTLRNGVRLARELAHRARVEERLRVSEADYKALFLAHPNPILVFDADTRSILAANDVALRFYGHPREGMLNLRLDDLAWDPIPSTSQHGRALETVFERHRTAEGRMVEVELEIPLQETHWRGRRARMALVRDITARRAAERLAHSAAEQSRLLLETTAEGIYALDREGRCLWANPAAARIFGYPGPELLIGRVMHDLIHHTREDGTPFPAAECRGMTNLRAGQGVVQPNELLWRADGTSFRAEVRVNPIAEHGEVTGAVVALSDISERLRIEEQFRHAQKMEAVGRLAAGVAHDYNNLLTVINGYAELLTLEAGEAPVLQHRAAAIAEAGRRAAALTTQLLAFSRQQVLQPDRLDLNTVVAHVEPMLRQIVREEIELRFHLAPDLPPVFADAGQIELALMNLVANSRDAIAAAGCIAISTALARVPFDAAPANLAPGEYVTVAIRDNGAGIDEATMSRLFEPFFTTKPSGKGTGLGLAAVFGMARQSGGAITVDSTPGSGTTMTVFLPVYTTADLLPFASRTAAADPASHIAPAPPAADGATVLLVEDETGVRQFATELLRDRGYDVIEAAGPTEALALAGHRPGPIHLLLTDMVMPTMSGRELADQLRRARPDLAVVYMSGYAGREADTGFHHDGAFLAKPFTPASLATAVDTALSRRT